jgi:hypothetical protein
MHSWWRAEDDLRSCEGQPEKESDHRSWMVYAWDQRHGGGRLENSLGVVPDKVVEVVGDCTTGTSVSHIQMRERTVMTSKVILSNNNNISLLYIGVCWTGSSRAEAHPVC